MRELSDLMALIGDVFVAEGLGCHVHAAIAGPHTLTYPVSIDDANEARLNKALRCSHAMEHRLEVPTRVLLQGRHIMVQVPREQPIIVYTSTLKIKALQQPQLTIPLGVSPANQVVTLDFEQIPHLGLFGATAFGKTTALVSILTQLARYNDRQTVRFLVLSAKPGQNGLPYVARFPHTWAVVSQDAEQVACIQWVDRFIRANADKAFRMHTFLVIDDYLSLAMTYPGLRNFVAKTIALSRSCGWHLLIGTQGANRDSGFTPNILRNLSRIVFGAANANDAQWLTGRADSGIDKLSMHKGDAVLVRTGDRHPQRLATSLTEPALLQSLAVGAPPSHRPWLVRTGTTKPTPELPQFERETVTVPTGTLLQGPALTASEQELVRKTRTALGSDNKAIAALWGGPPTPKTRRWLKAALVTA